MHSGPPKKRYYPVWWLLKGISLLPFPVLYLLSDFLYLLIYKIIGYREKVVWQNLKNSFPEKTDAALKSIMAQFYHNLCDIIIESVKLATIPRAELDKRVEIKNVKLLADYIHAGTTVITLGSHLANWEWALPSAAIKQPVPQEGIYKPLLNEFFEWYIVRLRTVAGGRLIKMKDTMRHLIRNRHIPSVLNILADQTPPGGEIQYWTTFLNQDTPFYVGGEKLANTFNYPVIFFGARRVKRGYYEFALELIHDNIDEMPSGDYPLTEIYARKLEKWIQAYPADYLWSHRRWKHKRQPETTALTSSGTPA